MLRYINLQLSCVYTYDLTGLNSFKKKSLNIHCTCHPLRPVIIPNHVSVTKISRQLKNSHLRTHFYRAMHFSASRGIAIACRLSVCPSVCDVGEL